MSYICLRISIVFIINALDILISFNINTERLLHKLIFETRTFCLLNNCFLSLLVTSLAHILLVFNFNSGARMVFQYSY